MDWCNVLFLHGHHRIRIKMCWIRRYRSAKNKIYVYINKNVGWCLWNSATNRLAQDAPRARRLLWSWKGLELEIHEGSWMGCGDGQAGWRKERCGSEVHLVILRLQHDLPGRRFSLHDLQLDPCRSFAIFQQRIAGYRSYDHQNDVGTVSVSCLFWAALEDSICLWVVNELPSLLLFWIKFSSLMNAVWSWFLNRINQNYESGIKA